MSSRKKSYFYFFCTNSNRYEQWTAPEYYQAANSNFQSSEEKRKKTVELENRREKLKGLLDSENKQYAKEIEGNLYLLSNRICYLLIKFDFFHILQIFPHSSEMSKPKARRVPTETLKGIQEVYKRTEEEKRRLELESQLYKRWRPASREESILLSSRSNNEALAKMNWLDKQV